MASPFLRFCPIGVKVIQAEYIQKNDLVVLHHCSYFRAASTSLEDTTEWVRYFNKIHVEKFGTEPHTTLCPRLLIKCLFWTWSLNKIKVRTLIIPNPWSKLCVAGPGVRLREGRSGILGSKCQMSLSSSRETYFHNVTHYSYTMWHLLAPQRLGKCHKYSA